MAKTALAFARSFSGVNPSAQKAAERHAARLVTVISDETKANIRNLIARSIKEGISPYEASRMIRGMVGLNQRQGQAAMNYRATLVKQGLRPDRIQVLMDRHTAKAIRYRAQTIARTEVMSALNEGQKTAWRQAQKDGLLGLDARKEWMTVDQACDICGPLNGKTVLLNESFGIVDPPAHPRCRCSLGVVPGMKSKAETSWLKEAQVTGLREVPFDAGAYDKMIAELDARNALRAATTKTAPWPVKDDVPRVLGKRYPSKVASDFKAWEKTLTAVEREAVMEYSNASREINRALREGFVADETLRDQIRLIQGALGKVSSARPPELVWRGVSGTDVEKIASKWATGDVIRLPGFQSTSLDPVLGANSGKVVFEIMPVRGGGAYIDGVSFNKGEYEFVLHHDKRYKVRGKTEVIIGGKKTKIIQLEMLP